MPLPVNPATVRRAAFVFGAPVALATLFLLALWLTGGLTSAGGGEEIVVNSPGDAADPTPNDGECSSPCSLRAAIQSANSNPGPDIIIFNIPGDGPHTITPGSPLPEVTDPVTIDGYTQPGAQPNTLGPKQGTNATLMIEIEGSNAGAGASGLTLAGGDHVVKGLVINRFDASGILLHDSEESSINDRNVVSGNFLGTAVDGMTALGNGVGVTIDVSWWNLIGGTSPGDNNLISGNGIGIVMTGNSMQNNVRGSIIGAARDGDTPLPNESHGVQLKDGALCNTIGMESVPGENIISFNGGAGVAMEDDTGINNYVDPNEMHDNGGLGIDLGNDGVTPNDENDLDTGPNDMQNYPVITSAVVHDDFDTLIVTGFLDSLPNTFMNLFFFINEECDPSGHGEGFEFIHSERFTTDSTGDEDFGYNIFSDAQPGDIITASLSTPESTSEFSACVTIESATPGTPTPTPTPTGQTPTPTPTGQTPTPTPTPTEPAQLTQGDVTCNNDVGATDALADLQHVAGLDPNQEPNCPEIGAALPAGGDPPIFGDVDCDGDVDATDALKILQHIAAIPYTQTEPCPNIGEPL